jgi:hypothetical protein
VFTDHTHFKQHHVALLCVTTTCAFTVVPSSVTVPGLKQKELGGLFCKAFVTLSMAHQRITTSECIILDLFSAVLLRFAQPQPSHTRYQL